MSVCSIFDRRVAVVYYPYVAGAAARAPAIIGECRADCISAPDHWVLPTTAVADKCLVRNTKQDVRFMFH